MASVLKRKNTWFGTWVGLDGRRHQKTTSVKVKSKGMTEKQTRMIAQSVADAMERAAKGLTPVEQAMESVRAVAVANGMAKPVPSIADYMTQFPAQACARAEQQRHRTFRDFLSWLGRDAKLPLTCISTDHMRGHLIWLLQTYRKGTVDRRREHLACAFNRARDIDKFITHSPMAGLKVSQLMRSIGGQDDTVDRDPFTADEMKIILYKFPQPYSDLAAVSYYLGGLRLGDSCMLRWENVDFDKGGVFVRERKTGKPRYIHLLPELRERLLARRVAQEEGEEFVFPEAARKYQYSPGTVSTRFTQQLRAFGIRKDDDEDHKALKGRRRPVARKSFHSLRHTAVSMGRSAPNLTPDIVRETVGHDSEKIERRYFTAADNAKLAVLKTLADMVRPDNDTDSDSDATAPAAV